MDPVADGFTRSCRSAVRDLRRMPADLRRELNTRVADDVTAPLAADVRAASFRAGPYSGLFEVRVRKGAEPTLAVGGGRSVARNGATGATLFYGVEFGGSRQRHQPAHRPYQRHYASGKVGSVWRNTTAQFVPAHPFVYPTFRREFADVTEAWLGVLDPILDQWEAGT